MTTRFAVPITQLVNDSASSVAAGWKLIFYITGTTTNKDTFSDAALTTANANPVVADSAGRFSDIFLESGTYKVVLTDENDVEKWTADPVPGGLGSSGAVDAKTTSYTVTIDDATKIIAVDASSGAVTITLLASATAGSGFELSVLKTDTSINAVTIDANGAETIDGAATKILNTQYQGITIRSDGTNWITNALTHITEVNVKGTAVATASGALTLGNGNIFHLTGTTGPVTSITSRGVGAELEFHHDAAHAFTHAEASLRCLGNASITFAAGEISRWREDSIGNWFMTSYERRGGNNMPRSYLAGLGLANNSGDAAKDLDIAVGVARNSTNVEDMILATALTKKLDAAWAVGTDAGGLDGTESVGGTPDATTWYHTYLIKREDTGVVDVLFSENATTPTLPTDYDFFRRIGAVLTDGTPDITAFTQFGDSFNWNTFPEDHNSDAGEGEVSVTLTVPTGYRVLANIDINLSIDAVSGNEGRIAVYPPDAAAQEGILLENDVVPSNVGFCGGCTVDVLTNTSAQIKINADTSPADENPVVVIDTRGWMDVRGRED